MQVLEKISDDKNTAASIVVLGSGIHNIKANNDSADALKDFEFNLSRIKPVSR